MVKIPHTLAASIPDSMLTAGPVQPARTQDSNAATSYEGPVALGRMVGIPPGVDVASRGLNTEAVALAVGQIRGLYPDVLVRAGRPGVNLASFDSSRRTLWDASVAKIVAGPASSSTDVVARSSYHGRS